MERFSLKTLLIIVVVLLIGIVGLFRIQQRGKSVMAGWYNDSWQYRKAITIGYTGASALTDFQVSVDIGTSALIAAGKMKSDCADIRFTDQTGKLLDYWIEENNPGCNQTTDTKIWIKLPRVNTTGTNIYLYYGNSSATSIQDGNKVFEFFDDFNNGTSKWTGEAGVTMSIVTESTNKVLALSNTTTWYGAFAGSEAMSDYIYEARVKTPATRVGLYARHKSSGNTDNGFYLRAEADNFGFSQNNGAMGLYGSSVIDASTWYRMKILAIGTSAILYFNDVNQNINNVFQNTTGSIGLTPIEPGTVYFDNIFVRKYAASDPTKTLLSEERSPAPIAYWSFDEGVGTSVFDSSSNRNNGLITGATWQTEESCLSGKCLKYNGTSNIDNTTINYGDVYTIETWIRPTDISLVESYGRTIIASSQDSNAFYPIWLLVKGNQIRALAYSNNINAYYVDSNFNNIQVNNWYHISLSATKNGNAYLYINGKLDSTFSAGPQNANQKITIGDLRPGRNIPFIGNIDDTKIYAYARTAAQIKQDYRAGLSGMKTQKGSSVAMGGKSAKSLSDGLVGYWKMDEGVGTTTADSSGNNYTGTFGTGDSAPSWSTGKYGIGASFNGNDTISLGTTDALNFTGSFSISTWIKTTQTATAGNYRAIIGKGYLQSGTNGYGLFINGDDSSKIVFQSRNNATISTATGTTISDGLWHHVVAIRDHTNNTSYIYIDGILSGTNTTTLSSGYSNSGYFAMGANNSATNLTYNFPFTGNIDEIRIYNRALTPAEVTALYEYAPGPVAYYNFEEGVGTTVYDRSGNNNNITWSSGTYSTGKFGKSGNFNGNDNYIYGTSFTNTPSVTDYSYGFWFYLNSFNHARMYAFDFRGNGSQASANAPLFLIDQSGSNCILDAYTGVELRSNAVPCLAQWHYISVIRSGSTTYIYMDGILQISGNAGTGTDLSVGKRIGTFSSATPGGNYWWNGKLDEFKFYSYARTQKQILQDMSANVPVGASTKVSKPIAWYKFDEGQGTIANNSGSIGSTSNGTFGTGNSAPTWTNDGKFNKALSLDGSDYVFLPGSNLENIGAVGDFTVTAWNNQSSFSGVEVIVGQGFAGAPGGHTYGRWQIGTSGSKGWISLYGGASSPSYKKLTGLINLSANTWNYIAAIYSRSESKLKLYINGKYDSQLNWDGYIENVFTNRMVIGYNSGTNAQYMTGLIDEVKIYNYALSADEIKQDYNQGSSAVIGKSNQTIGATTTSLDYCIPGDTTACSAPIAEYNFEENIGTTAYDTSGNGLNGVFGSGNASPSWTTGKTGSGLNFDESKSQYIRTIAGNNQTFSSAITMEAWIKKTSAGSSYDWIVTKDTDFGFTFNANLTRQLRVFKDNGSTYATSNTFAEIADNKWHHVAATFDDPSNFLQFYVDGKAVGVGDSSSFNFSALNTNSSRYYIGSWVGPDHFFKGQIDNVRIYNYARTPAQIAYDYNKGGPIGWWKMDECEGATVHNSAADPATAGLGSTGTIVIGAGGSQVSLGTCSIGDTSAWSNGATGKINSAMSFDGTDDVITINDSPNLRFNSNDFSITAWIKHSSTINGILRGIYTKGGTAAGGFSLYIEFGNKLRFINQNSTTFDSNKIVADNTWHHIVASRKGNDLYYYIDGNLDNTSVNYFNGITLNDSSNVLIGLRDANRYFNGLIDDVRIYNYALTAEQVKQVYNGGAVSFN